MPSASEAVIEALRLCQVDDDESEPYKSRYAAADLLLVAIKALEVDLVDDATPAAAKPDIELSLATLHARRGLALVETDLLADADTEMNAALPALERPPLQAPAALLEVYNALGALASNRGVHEAAIPWLEKAEAVYAAHKPAAAPKAGLAPASALASAAASDTAVLVPAAAAATADPATNGATPAADEPAPDAPAASAAATGEEPATSSAPASASNLPASSLDAAAAKRLEDLHTSTLFYLAQVRVHHRGL